MNVAVLSMLRRFAVLVVAALTATAARATDFTDLWWTPSEPGWGVNVVQSDAFMFLTFFIYGADNKPTWYTAQLTRDASGNFGGGLYSTTGTYYAKPWSTADSTPPQQVGSAQFRPSASNAYQATLAYAVDGVGAVVKEVERQTLTPITLGGTYVGGQAARQTNCGNTQSYKNTYDLQVTQTPSGTVTFEFAFISPVYACSLSGTYVQTGALFAIPGAEYKCFQNGATVLSTSANISEIKATSQGIEGRWTATVGSGCIESSYFSAVLR